MKARVACGHCPKTFKNKGSKDTHERTYHRELRDAKTKKKKRSVAPGGAETSGPPSKKTKKKKQEEEEVTIEGLLGKVKDIPQQQTIVFQSSNGVLQQDRELEEAIEHYDENPINDMAIMKFDAKRDLVGCRITPDGKYVALYDGVSKLFGCPNSTAISKIESLPIYGRPHRRHQFPGRGQHPTPIVPISELLQICARLPNCPRYIIDEAMKLSAYVGAGSADVEVAVNQRRQTIDSATKTMLAGDLPSSSSSSTALRAEEDADVARINKQARLAAAQKELAKTMKELEEIANERRDIAVKGANIELQAWKSFQDEIIDNHLLDEPRDKIFVKDRLRNAMLKMDRCIVASSASSQQLLLKEEESNIVKELNISDVVMEQLGRHPKSSEARSLNIKAGRAVAKLFREKHKKDPPKRDQFVDGRAIKVNLYYETDRALVEEGVKSVLVEMSA